jgi:RNA polymerase sigma-70 factor (ECF subfamily)
MELAYQQTATPAQKAQMRSPLELNFEATLAGEQARLRGLCARLTGDPGAAEDLAQETMLEAWRQFHRLTNAEGLARWLNAIARNMCLRWRHERGRAGFVSAPLLEEIDGDESDTWPAAPALEGDPALGLEREERLMLLERALAVLPTETRRIVVERYVEERSQAEVAERLGLGEGTVAVRLHRGRQALRCLLAGELREEALALGLLADSARGWQQTSIWCTACGQRHLVGRFSPTNSELVLRCPGCHTGPEMHTIHHVSYVGLFDGISGFKPAYSRALSWAADYYSRALAEGSALCTHCQRRVPLYLGLPASHPLKKYELDAFHMACAACGYPENNGNVETIVLGLSEGRRFWRQHPRILRLPDREVEAAGQPAFVVTYESVSDSARLETVFTRDRYALLNIAASPGG